MPVYPFYQKSKSTGQMYKIGEHSVPEERDVWYFPRFTDLSVVKDTPIMPPVIEELCYRRVKSDAGTTFFVADTD